MDSFSKLIRTIQTQEPTKWFIREERLCVQLGIDRTELGPLLDRLTRGGTGSKKDGTFKSNPEPCNMRIDLKSSDENALNFHYETVKGRGARVEIREPSPSVIKQTGRYFQFGKLSDKHRYVDVDRRTKGTYPSHHWYR